jgi:arylsulfatase A-like enzyme
VPLPRRVPTLALVALAPLAACAPGGATAAARAPDVLLLTFDALPVERAGLLAAPDSATPALDAFAADALVLERATAPWSLPALASWMSGMPVEAHRCDGPAGVLDARFTTLAERLLPAGYDTACIVAELAATTRHGLTQGFVHVDESLAFPEVDPALARPAQALADRAIRFVDQRAAVADGNPWLLWVHFAVPGGAETAADELRALDGQVGRVLARARAHADTHATVVLVAGASRTSAGEPAPAALAVLAPELAPARSAEEARPIDVLPTLLALAGLPPDEELPGTSVVR